jgi:ribose-phosphate pyrophosphokinase
MANEISILADPKGNAWNFAEEVYTKLINHPDTNRTYNLGKVEIKKFNDGEIYANIKDSIRKQTCFFIHDSSMAPQDWLVSLAVINDSLMRSDAAKVDNVLPYMRYSRQDRMAEPRTPITARIVADIIEDRAYRVITADLHNPAVQGFYKLPFENLKAYPAIIEHLQKNYSDFLKDAVIVAPDEGSTRRAGSYSRRLNLPMITAYKERKQAGVVDKIEILGNLDGKNVLIPDDMIDTGGTLIKAAEKAKEKGAKHVYACATHGVFSNNAKERLNQSVLEKIIITDSIPQKSDGKIEVITLTELFAETIYRISHGKSISELFA